MQDKYKKIDVTEGLSIGQFYEDYFSRRRPVLFKNLMAKNNLLEASKLSYITSIASLADLYPTLKLKFSEGFRPDYFSTFKNSSTPEDEANQLKPIDEATISKGRPNMTLVEYNSHLESNPHSSLFCSENKVPSEFENLFPIPKYCNLDNTYNDVQTQFFLGTANHFAHMHYDTDARHVILYQLFGKKRVVLIPPESSRILSAKRHWSMLNIKNLNHSQLKGLLKLTNGTECIIEGGDALYFPCASWHYIEYLSDTCSIRFAFGRNKYTTFLSEKLHPCSQVQKAIVLFSDINSIDDVRISAFDRIVTTYNSPCADINDKCKQIEDVISQVLYSISKLNPSNELYIPESEGLEASMKTLDNYQYQHLTPQVYLSGWNYLPKSNSL